MNLTWIPDDMSGPVKYKDTTVEEFLAKTGFLIHGKFEGPGMYVTTDGVPSAADIAEEVDNPFGSINGSLIVR